MNLDQMRVFVRAQLDLDITDLPDVLLDVYIQDGFDRAISLERSWPFFESLWTITVNVNGTATLPVDVAEFAELSLAGNLLTRVDVRWAVGAYGIAPVPAGTPQAWFVVNRTLYVMPPPSAPVELRAHGYRMGADWVAQGASSPCDADPRLHVPICWYACSLGYAQQEDEVLEATYLNRFKEGVSIAHQAIMRPWAGQPRQAFYRSYRYGPAPARFLAGVPVAGGP